MRVTSLLLAVSSVAVLLATTGPTAHAQRRVYFDPAVTYNVPVGASPTRGPADALVTVVEFSDFGCRYCGRAQSTLAQLRRLYGERIRFVFRSNPLDMEEGTLAAEAALAAHAQGRFWPMHDRIFISPKPTTRDGVIAYAQELGLDMTRFRRDLDGHLQVPWLQKDVAAAKRLGASSTPMFFVNGRPVRGARPLRAFVHVIEQEFARARGLIKRGAARSTLYRQLVRRGRLAGQTTRPAVPNHPSNKLDTARLYRVGLGLTGHRRGPDDALVTIVEFSDFECSYCRKALPTIRAIEKEFPTQVRVVYRHMPLSFHRRAQLAAEAAVEAARQGKFWAFHDRLFANQKRLTRPDLEAHAVAVGLDMRRFRRALNRRSHRGAVELDTATANAMGVSGTPTFFVNGTPVVGAARLDFFRKIVQTKLGEAQKLVAAGVTPAKLYQTVLTLTPGSFAGTASSTGPVDADPSAVVAACQSGEGAAAESLYGKIGASAGGARARAEARRACSPYGVDLPE